MLLTEQDYYAALEITPAATPEQVEKAYRFAIDNYAPGSLATYGLLRDDERRNIVGFIEEAHKVLADTRLRLDYDQRLRERGIYADDQFIRASSPNSSTASVQPVSQPSKPTVDDTAATTVSDTTFDELKPKERSWWPFAEKEKAADKPVEKDKIVEEALQAAPVITEPEPPKTGPTVLPALDGRPIGGPELRQIREARGLTLEDVSNKTKISLSNLRFIEAANVNFLPASVYVKGFIRTYAKMLAIDTDKAVTDYMQFFDARRPA